MSDQTLTTADLDAIEARANAATPGRAADGCWEMRDGWGPLDADGLHRAARISADDATVLRAGGNLIARQEDFEFIATARADVPALVREVRRLRALVETP